MLRITAATLSLCALSAAQGLPRFEQTPLIQPMQRHPGVIYTMGTAASASHGQFNDFLNQAIQKSPVIVVVEMNPRQLHHVEVQITDQQSGSPAERVFCDNTAHFIALRPLVGTPYSIRVIPGNPGANPTTRVWVFEGGKQIGFKTGNGQISFDGMTF